MVLFLSQQKTKFLLPPPPNLPLSGPLCDSVHHFGELSPLDVSVCKTDIAARDLGISNQVI